MIQPPPSSRLLKNTEFLQSLAFIFLDEVHLVLERGAEF